VDSKQRKFGNYRIPDSDCRTIARRSGIKIKLNAGRYATAFSLLEVIAALVILALVSSSVLVVINRCMGSAADSALRMQAFELARENMETLLSKDSVSVKVEYGASDKYPQIQWQTVMEAFYESVTERMWLQATCSAEYTDSAGEQQTVELTHWLTDLTKKQMLEIIQQQRKEVSAEQIIENIEQAAEYAGVDVETIEQWVENGMPVTEDGYLIKEQLDLYKKSDGKPSIEDIKRLSQDDADSIKPTEQQEQQLGPDKQDVVKPTVKKKGKPDTYPDLICGYTMQELMQLDFAQMFEIISNCDELRR